VTSSEQSPGWRRFCRPNATDHHAQVGQHRRSIFETSRGALKPQRTGISALDRASDGAFERDRNRRRRKRFKREIAPVSPTSIWKTPVGRELAFIFGALKKATMHPAGKAPQAGI